jgi:preprotein translocase subunit SecA
VIENAQKKVEARNFDIRKHLLEYDNVMNYQRLAFYSRRRDALEREDVHEEVYAMVEGVIVALLDVHWPAKGEPDTEVMQNLAMGFTAQFGVEFDPTQPPFVIDDKPAPDRDALGCEVRDRVVAMLEEKKKTCDALAEQHASDGYPDFAACERSILLQILDTQWKDHLHTMDGLREGIQMRAYGQRDPKLEYQREGFALYQDMEVRVDGQSVDLLCKFILPQPPSEAPQRSASTLPQPARESAGGPGPLARPGSGGAAPRGGRAGKAGKVGRNDPCPCGSGKKYKKCHGAA